MADYAAIIDQMTRAARALVDALTPEQASRARISFGDHGQRVDWHYRPRRRAGLAFGWMDAAQHKLAQRLVATGLSSHAHAQVTTIIGLEDVLDEIEGGRRGRTPADYFVTIFGDPASGAAWGWRLEGHHVSLNYTLCGQALSWTPLFLGANPAVVRRGAREVVRPLRDEEEAARELLASLDAEQRLLAVISEVAPADLVTGNLPRLQGAVRPGDVTGLPAPGLSAEQRDALTLSGEPKGLPASRMDGRQRALLSELADVYIHRVPVPVARQQAARIAGADVSFAWAGAEAPGAPHYYRLQAPGFLSEYDNTQNDANHIHSVWRIPDDDFGASSIGSSRPSEERT